MTEKGSSMKSLRAYEKIRDMILTGRKFPGSRLVLSELEEELGIGRGPIRDAMMRLDRSGLVKNIPYKGAVVAAPPTLEEVLHIFDLRIELESTLAMTAMANLTVSDMEKLDSLHAKMKNLSEDYYQHDREFHHTIYSASKMPHLLNIANTLIFSVEGVMNIYQRGKEHREIFNVEHQAIIAALRSGDREKIRKAITTNIKSGLIIIKETYSKLLHASS